MLVGKKKGEEDWYVKIADNPQVFLVKKYNLERMNKRPIEFRDKTLCNLKSDEITEVAVTHDKESFTLAKQGERTGRRPSPRASPRTTRKVTHIAGAFADWKGQGFAEDSSPKATGLGKPTATIVAKSSVKGHGCHAQGRQRDQRQGQLLRPSRRPARRLRSCPSGRSTACWSSSTT